MKVYRADLHDFVERSSCQMRIHAPAFKKVLKDGEFKNQYTVGKSEGYYGPSRRKDAELEMLGISVKPPPPDNHRPIYGYIHPTGMLIDEKSGVDNYGTIRVTLKDHIKDRATFTVGDSLGAGIKPSPFYDPGVESISSYGTKPTLGQTMIETEGGVSYIEAQYHGGLAVPDIDHVTFVFGGVDRAVTSKLDKMGIPWKEEVDEL